MFALDDRTGNVVMTVALFAAVAGVVFAARATLVVFLLALLAGVSARAGSPTRTGSGWPV